MERFIAAPFSSNGTGKDKDNEPVLSKLDEIADYLRQLLPQPTREPPPLVPSPVRPKKQLVTLDQAAAMVNRKKETLRGYRDLPAPAVRGRRGQVNLYDWEQIRPWLEETFGVRLDENYPQI